MNHTKQKTKKQTILDLRAEGLSYNQIVKRTGFSKGLISYHLNDNVKTDTIKRNTKHRKDNPLRRKISAFRNGQKKIYSYQQTKGGNRYRDVLMAKTSNFQKNSDKSFAYEDVLQKFGEHPKCALTGAEIDYHDSASYAFDHIKARAKGGDNSLNNLQLLTRVVNKMKDDMTNEELIDQCVDILLHVGVIEELDDSDEEHY